MTPEYLRVSECAELLHISRGTVLRWIRNGILPGVRIGGTYLVDRAALRETLDAHRVAS